LTERSFKKVWALAGGFVLATLPCLIAGERHSLKEMREILASEGIAEVIDYIDDTEKSSMRQTLIRDLLAEAKLSDKHLASLAETAEEFESDTHRVETYQQILRQKNAGARVQKAILDDVDEIENNAMRAEILKQLVNKQQATHLHDLLEEIDALEVDAFKAELFKKTVQTYSTRQLMAADLLSNLEDFHNKHIGFEVLNALVEKNNMNERDLEMVLETAVKLSDSNGQLLSNFLIKVSDKGTPGKIFFEVTSEIESDDFKVSILLPVLEKYGSPKTVSQVVACVDEVKSPDSKTKILLKAVDVTGPQDVLMVDLVEAVGDIGQELQSCKVYSKILKKDLGSEQLTLIIKEMPKNVTLDHNRSNILIEATRRSEIDDNFFDTVEEFSSSYEKGRVLRSVLDRHDLNEEQLEAMIRISMTITSDYEKFKTLHALLQKHELSLSLEYIFEEAIESLDKAHYRKTLERALHH